MITYLKKDITTVTRGVVGNGTNCLGLMGAGVALAIRNKWNNVYNDYVKLVQKQNNPEDLLGTTQVIEINENELYVANCFTQVNCGHDGKVYASVSAIQDTLTHIVEFALYHNLPLYIPKIGCGLGGLSWSNDIQPIVEELVTSHPDLELYVVDL